MVQRVTKEEKGYTIVEILIALTLVSVILGVTSSIFIFANRQLNNWSSKLEFFNTAHISQNQLYNDMFKARDIVFTDTSLVLSDGNTTYAVYNWTEGKLSKNGTYLNSIDKDSLFIFEKQPLYENEQLMGWQIKQISGKSEITIDQILHTRKPILWTSLEDF